MIKIISRNWGIEVTVALHGVRPTAALLEAAQAAQELLSQAATKQEEQDKAAKPELYTMVIG